MLLPGRRPELAALGEVIALHELPLAHVAAKKCAAVLVNAVAEVLTRHAAAGSFPALQLAIIHEVPIVHNAPSKYICTNASGGLGAMGDPAQLRLQNNIAPKHQRISG